jgi:trk system potassium uptake protein TrkA
MRELGLMIRGDARVFSFVAKQQNTGTFETLQLSVKTRVVRLYRNGEFPLPDSATLIHVDDEIVIIRHRNHLDELVKRWGMRIHGSD